MMAHVFMHQHQYKHRVHLLSLYLGHGHLPAQAELATLAVMGDQLPTS